METVVDPLDKEDKVEAPALSEAVLERLPEVKVLNCPLAAVRFVVVKLAIEAAAKLARVVTERLTAVKETRLTFCKEERPLEERVVV